MKKTVLSMIISAFGIAAGLAIKPLSKMLCIFLVIGGVILFLTAVAVLALDQMQKKCPVCGQRIHVSIGQYNRLHAGMIPCPRCGALVRVDHVSPR